MLERATYVWPFFVSHLRRVYSCRTGRRGCLMMYNFLPICENKDFRRAYARGKSYVSPVIVTYVAKNRFHTLRVGITTSKKTGNAVKRNRSRRIIREAVRQMVPNIKEGYDLIFVARAKTPFVKSTDILFAITKQLKEAGVLK